MDNRGVGKSSCPQPPEKYRTSIMANDVLALMVRLCDVGMIGSQQIANRILVMAQMTLAGV